MDIFLEKHRDAILGVVEGFDRVIFKGHLTSMFPEGAFGRYLNKRGILTVRTIKMTKETAAKLRPSSKFKRSRTFIDGLREEGRHVAREWLSRWPHVGCYPEDAAYW